MVKYCDIDIELSYTLYFNKIDKIYYENIFLNY